MKIFAGSASGQLAKQIATSLSTKLSPIELHVFPDGEQRVKLNADVVDEKTIVVQSTGIPTDSNLMQLFFLLDALKRSGAREVTAVVPYLGYSRQDHVFREGEARSLEVVIRLIEDIGADKVVSFDLHSIKIPEMFLVPIKHLTALPLFAQKIQLLDWNDAETVLVTPDMGGIRRIEILSQLLHGMPYACVEKNRDLTSGNVEASIVHGELKKRAVIVDDMISSGGTIVTACELLKSKGVEEMIVCATHPVFSGKAAQKLQASLAQKVFVTDTIELPKEKQFEKLEILSVAPMIAEELRGL